MDSSAVVSFEGVNERNIEQLKDINAALFPIKYQNRVYQQVLHCGDVSQLAMAGEKCIGAIGCRLQRAENNIIMLYILTLGVLAPYRNQGVGSELLKRCLYVCQFDSAIKRADLHVHVANIDAIRFYKHHGFQEVRVDTNYYKNLTPGDAVLLRRPILLPGTEPTDE